MKSRSLVFVIIALLTAIYPFAVYFGISHYGPTPLALVLLSVLIARALFAGERMKTAQTIQLALVGGLCLFAICLQSESLLLYYPVIMSLCIAGFFWFSLSTELPLIERFASVFKNEISDHAKRYMRGLTKIWAIILLLNASVAFYTACCLSVKQWALYNGAIAYIVFAVFTVFELVNRHFFKKRHGGL